MSSFEDMLKASPAWFAISMIAAGVAGGVAGTKWLEGKIDGHVSNALIAAKATGDFRGEAGAKGEPGIAGKLGERGEPGEKGETGGSGENATLPSGIVVASWKRCEVLGSEWSDFHAGNGRMIVGAGDPAHDPFRHRLTKRTSWTPRVQDPTAATVGGLEKVTLTEAQMPSHSHRHDDIYWSELESWKPASAKSLSIPSGIGHKGEKDGGNVGWAVNRSTSKTPANFAHPNMPPYIALYFCKKS